MRKTQKRGYYMTIGQLSNSRGTFSDALNTAAEAADLRPCLHEFVDSKKKPAKPLDGAVCILSYSDLEDFDDVIYELQAADRNAAPYLLFFFDDPDTQDAGSMDLADFSLLEALEDSPLGFDESNTFLFRCSLPEVVRGKDVRWDLSLDQFLGTLDDLASERIETPVSKPKSIPTKKPEPKKSAAPAAKVPAKSIPPQPKPESKPEPVIPAKPRRSTAPTRAQLLTVVARHPKILSYSFRPVEQCKETSVQSALNAYAVSCPPESVVALLDTSLFGTGKSGFLLTEDALYGSVFSQAELPGKRLPLARLIAAAPGSDEQHIRLTMADGTEIDAFFSLYAPHLLEVLQDILAL